MKNRETRELLIEKAIDLFYERGFGRSSIRDIVKSAGVTNSAVYNHFRDKDELLYVIIERIGSRILEILHDVEARHEHPLDRLTEMIFQQTCIVKERKKEVKIYLEEQYQLSPKLKRKALNQHRIVYDFYMKQLCDLQKIGLLRSVNKTVANFSCFAMMNWSYRWFKEDGELSIEEVARSLIDIFFKGILDRDTAA